MYSSSNSNSLNYPSKIFEAVRDLQYIITFPTFEIHKDTLAMGTIQMRARPYEVVAAMHSTENL